MSACKELFGAGLTTPQVCMQTRPPQAWPPACLRPKQTAAHTLRGSCRLRVLPWAGCTRPSAADSPLAQQPSYLLPLPPLQAFCRVGKARVRQLLSDSGYGQYGGCSCVGAISPCRGSVAVNLLFGGLPGCSPNRASASTVGCCTLEHPSRQLAACTQGGPCHSCDGRACSVHYLPELHHPSAPAPLPPCRGQGRWFPGGQCGGGGGPVSARAPCSCCCRHGGAACRRCRARRLFCLVAPARPHLACFLCAAQEATACLKTLPLHASKPCRCMPPVPIPLQVWRRSEQPEGGGLQQCAAGGLAAQKKERKNTPWGVD